jgi:hypothetical protein
VFGCLGRLGCLVLLVIAAILAWFTRDRWYPRFFGDRGAVGSAWEPVTDSGAAVADRAVSSLSKSGGPSYVTLSASQLAALIASRAGGGLPSSVDSVQAAIEDDKVLLRASIQLDEIRGLDGLGPLGSLLNRRERLQVSGTLDVVRQGLAEYKVESAQIGELPLPRAAIPRLIARMSRTPRPEGVSDNGIPFRIPDDIADVRVSRGRVTVYKNVQ